VISAEIVVSVYAIDASVVSKKSVACDACPMAESMRVSGTVQLE
jgi:hypothetical protein